MDMTIEEEIMVYYFWVAPFWRKIVKKFKFYSKWFIWVFSIIIISIYFFDIILLFPWCDSKDFEGINAQNKIRKSSLSPSTSRITCS